MMACKMMYGMPGGIPIVFLLSISLLLGFAYIVWVLASKESGNVKTVGQVISISIAVLVAAILLYGGIYGGMTGQCGGGRMMKHKMMMESK